MSNAAKILLVEDNPDDEELTLRALRHHKIGDDVIVAHDGVEALDFLFARGDFSDTSSERMPDVVLLDLNLPRVNGHEVLEAMRADVRTRSLPVVVLTSSNEERDIKRSYHSGANSYIRKPVDYRKFVHAVEKISDYWLDLNLGPETHLN